MTLPRALLAITLVASLATVAPTGSSDTPTDGAPEGVALHVDAPARLLSLHEPFAHTHAVAWADVAALNATGTPNGLDLLLAAATALGFTVAVEWYDFDGLPGAESAYVTEIDGLAHSADGFVYSWAVLENGEYAGVGANGLTLAPGSEILFRYEGWLVPA